MGARHSNPQKKLEELIKKRSSLDELRKFYKKHGDKLRLNGGLTRQVNRTVHKRTKIVVTLASGNLLHLAVLYENSPEVISWLKKKGISNSIGRWLITYYKTNEGYAEQKDILGRPIALYYGITRKKYRNKKMKKILNEI